MALGQNVTRIRNRNPWIPTHPMSGFDIMSAAQLLLMGFGAYFLISKAKDFLGRFINKTNTSMPTHN